MNQAKKIAIVVFVLLMVALSAVVVYGYAVTSNIPINSGSYGNTAAHSGYGFNGNYPSTGNSGNRYSGSYGYGMGGMMRGYGMGMMR
jgi:hypothetical protein